MVVLAQTRPGSAAWRRKPGLWVEQSRHRIGPALAGCGRGERLSWRALLVLLKSLAPMGSLTHVRAVEMFEQAEGLKAGSADVVLGPSALQRFTLQRRVYTGRYALVWRPSLLYSGSDDGFDVG
jgi:hypothetical protein